MLSGWFFFLDSKSCLGEYFRYLFPYWSDYTKKGSDRSEVGCSTFRTDRYYWESQPSSFLPDDSPGEELKATKISTCKNENRPVEAQNHLIFTGINGEKWPGSSTGV